MEFLDSQGQLIHQIKGSDYGDWHTIQVEEGYGFIGFQETHCADYLKAIGFQTMKQVS